MRAALLSDMHGNAVAFRAALADVERQDVDLIVSLGDVAQGGPQPRECVELLRELGCQCARGNSDDFLVTLDLGAEQIDDEEQRNRVLDTLRWAREQIGEDGLAVLRGFEPTIEVGRLLCCHATPKSNEDVILPATPPAEVVRALEGIEADAVAVGHVHQQWLRRFDRTLWFCVGAIGVAPSCEYALVDVDNPAIEFRRIPFDVEELIRAARASDFPHFEQWAAMWQP